MTKKLKTDITSVRRLYNALTDAKDHLEYCGYGDSWERECADAAKLPKKIEDALEGAKIST